MRWQTWWGACAAVFLVLSAACDGANGEQTSPSSTATARETKTGALTPGPTATPTPEPPFVGMLNGIEIDPNAPERTAFDVCPPDGLTLPEPGTFEEVASASGPMQVDPSRLSQGVSVRDSMPPDVFLCDGSPAQVLWVFGVAAGTPNVNPGGGSVVVHRISGLEAVKRAAGLNRWVEVTIAGNHGVIFAPLNPTDPDTPGCYLTLYDASADVTTEVAAFTGNNDFCIDFARALFE